MIDTIPSISRPSTKDGMKHQIWYQIWNMVRNTQFWINQLSDINLETFHWLPWSELLRYHSGSFVDNIFHNRTFPSTIYPLSVENMTDLYSHYEISTSTRYRRAICIHSTDVPDRMSHLITYPIGNIIPCFSIYAWLAHMSSRNIIWFQPGINRCALVFPTRFCYCTPAT